MPYRLYIILPVPKEHCVDISMNFILVLFRSRKGRDFILFVLWIDFLRRHISYLTIKLMFELI